SEMVNPGTFRGARHEYLVSQMPLYRDSVHGGFSKDAIAIIQRGYFKRFPIDLPMDQDPSPEALDAVDNNAPDVEPEPLNEEGMSEEELEAYHQAAAKRRDSIERLKAQIQRRMGYMLDRENDPDPKETGAHNPYRLLAYKLTGKSGKAPRRKTGKIKPNGQAGIREKVVKDLYSNVPDDEKAVFETRAAAEHEKAIRKWKAEMEGPISTNPEDRQRCIQGLVRFTQPILDLICEATGWKATLIAGGPEPAHNGQLNVVSIHSGKTLGEVPMTFGRSEREKFKSDIVPIFGKFLKKCYSDEVGAPETAQVTMPVVTRHDAAGVSTPAASLDVTTSAATAAAMPLLSPSAPPSPVPSHPPSPIPPPRPASPMPLPPSYPPSPMHREGVERLLSPELPIQYPRGQKRKSQGLAASKGKAKGPDATDANPTPTKRRRPAKVSLSHAPAAPNTSIDVPWFKKAMQLLTSTDLGPRWNRLLEAWSKFEEAHKFEGDSRLKATNRPSIISDWIQRARSVSWDPRISDVAKFDWDSLQLPGQNGLLSVIAGLYFWGVKCHVMKKAATTKEEWSQMVEDVVLVCNSLVQTQGQCCFLLHIYSELSS
ncbi:hypothetical protein CPC08DRAFT_649983, partial [Agrocybe pediades]